MSGKVVLVTGAGSGIGRGIALRAAESGASVVVADIDAERARATVEMLATAGGLAVEVDITSAEQVREMVSRAVEEFGRLDGAVNNAGVWPAPKSMLEHTQEDLDRTWAVNVKGTWNCLVEEARQMRAAGAGSIVNIGSAVGLRAQPGTGAYSASKAAILHFTKVAARELAADGVRVNAVCPGPIDSPEFASFAADPDEARRQVARMVPLGRIGQATDVAQAVLWLCSEDTSYVTGEVLSVDGGERA